MYFSISAFRMAVKLCRFALCVGVRDNTCLMIYEDDLNALEVRREFDGARIGNWYRLELDERWEQRWEKVDERMPTKREERTIKGKLKEFVKICLPIFCVPNLSIFGCKWKKAKMTDEKWNIELYSPRLKSAIKVNANVSGKELIEIRDNEHFHAFLTFTFVQSGSTVNPPQWSLNSVADIQNPNAGSFNDDMACILRTGIPSPLHCSTAVGKPTEWGILRKIDRDPNDENCRIGSILCLDDSVIAYGRIFAIREDCWRAEVGDTVGFRSIDVVDLFEKPVRVAFNVLCWKYHNLHATSSELLEDERSLIGFDTDSGFHMASTELVAPSESPETEFDSIWDIRSDAKALVLVETPPNDVVISAAMREDKRRCFLPTQQQMHLQHLTQRQPQVSEKDKQPEQDGLCMFVHSKGDDVFLRLFDERTRTFGQKVSVNEKKAHFPPGTTNPMFEWFRITYRKQKTERTIEVVGLLPLCEAKLAFWRSHLVKGDSDLQKKLRDSKEEVRI